MYCEFYSGHLVYEIPIYVLSRLLDELAYYYSGDRQDLQNNQHIAIWQLATALVRATSIY